jgi:hypothetical protein
VLDSIGRCVVGQQAIFTVTLPRRHQDPAYPNTCLVTSAVRQISRLDPAPS